MTLAGGGQRTGRAHDVLFDIRRFTNERRAIPEAHKGGDVAARALDNRRDRSAGLLVRVEPGPGEQVPAQKPLTDDLRAGMWLHVPLITDEIVRLACSCVSNRVRESK